jgi:hypothetical protein
MTDPIMALSPSADDPPFGDDFVAQEAPAASGFNPDPNKYYYLSADYRTWDGQQFRGYLESIGGNPATAFWDYIEMSRDTSNACQLKFKKYPGQPWYSATVKEDGYTLDLKATGWLYRASGYNGGFMISDGRLYTNRWAGPMGYANSYGLMPDTYFVGAGNMASLENCRIEEV